MRVSFLASVFIVFLFSSCRYFGGERISGNGHVVTQERGAGSFNSVHVSGGIKVHIRQDSVSSLKVEADQNLMEYIDVYNDGSTLVIKEKEGFNLNPTKNIVVYATAPIFKDIEVSGACDIIGDGPIRGNEALSMHVSGSGDMVMQVDLPRISAEISGSGSIRLTGQATNFSAEVSGSGDVKCFDLITDNTDLDLSGSSDVEVTANKQLKVDASGSSSVQYKGNASVNQSISGSGSVKKVG
ncbi:MAG: head GIN domain-containing protein [Flavisolibacter sp.]